MRNTIRPIMRIDTLRVSSYATAVRTLQAPIIVKMVSAVGDVLLLAIIRLFSEARRSIESCVMS